MGMVTPSTLANLHFFENVSAESLEKIASVSKELFFKKQQIILLESEADTPVFFVLHGSVRIFRTSPEGREITIATIRTGEPFNIPSAFTPHPSSPASAAAITNATVLTISQADFRRVVSETPELALTVLCDLSQKLQKMVALTYDLGLRSVRGRLANFLLENANTDGTLAERWTQQQIAAHIGTAREVVSRTLRQFANADIIAIKRQRITILDAAALKNQITH